MSRVFVHGVGAVSPAGWGVEALREALRKGEQITTTEMPRPGWTKPLQVRSVPPPTARPQFLAHPRLRRSGAITQHTVGAALEALGADLPLIQRGELKLGLVVCLMSGSVTYSRRFFEEVLGDPSVASPMLFPETVYNAPGSHLAAYLNSNTVSYTLVGDDSSFLEGLAVAAGWLADGSVQGCVVVGAEESDWLVADASRLFDRRSVQGSGAGAIYLRREVAANSAVELACITDAFAFNSLRERANAVKSVRAQLPVGNGNELLCLATHGLPRRDADEVNAWRDWKGATFAPKEILGEAFTASAAWQCVAACDAIARGECKAANVSILGASRQAIGARFVSSAHVPSK